ncbi:MAG: DUF438 domain-containing protein, partial [Candidatus Bathyarchaeia archaeon]
MTEDRKQILKDLIRQLHAGVPPNKVKERFKGVLEGLNPSEIAKVEEELIKEGMPREEIQRLCDVHLAVFKEQLEKQKMEVPPGNPISILSDEHSILLEILEKLNIITDKIQQSSSISDIGNEITQLRHVSEDLLDAEKHYLREENVLFPILEKHGITEPPAIMWMEHNQLREKKSQLKNLVERYDSMSFQDFKKQLVETVSSLSSVLSSHLYKENNILFPMALQVFTDEELIEIQKEFDEIGYCSFTPTRLTTKPQIKEVLKEKSEPVLVHEDVLRFETGSLSRKEIEAVLNTLPVDITFVDKDDTVKYFSTGERRIFVRTKAVIGRKVQLCHPQKSIHIVNKILEEFKKGTKDVAEFWIRKNDHLIHIRYFPVRDRDGEYLGTMEVTQDVTSIKKLEGEKR